jgi:4-diphosphocytidyl-2-C-methyl-D-erythritol kinase
MRKLIAGPALGMVPLRVHFPLMRVQAPAKINLHLRVGPLRADGFHPIVTWMSTVGLFDILEIDRTHGRFELRCDAPGVPCDAGNLVVKAAAALADSVAEGSSAGLIASFKSPTHFTQQEMGEDKRDMDRGPGNREGGAMTDFGLSVALQKRIPVGAGLGGGSSDGASILLALNHLWRLNWPPQRLAEVAKTVGSDVAFFLSGPSAICRGRGEEVAQTERPAVKWVPIIFWPRPMPTPLVYRKFDELRLGKDSNLTPEPPWLQWVKLKSQELLPLLVNDLESAAFAIDPQLGQVRTELESLLKRPVRMSGSGSSLFSLYDERQEAEAATRLVMQRHNVQALTVELAPAVSESLNDEKHVR